MISSFAKRGIQWILSIHDSLAIRTHIISKMANFCKYTHEKIFAPDQATIDHFLTVFCEAKCLSQVQKHIFKEILISGTAL